MNYFFNSYHVFVPIGWRVVYMCVCVSESVWKNSKKNLSSSILQFYFSRQSLFSSSCLPGTEHNQTLSCCISQQWLWGYPNISLQISILQQQRREFDPNSLNLPFLSNSTDVNPNSRKHELHHLKAYPCLAHIYNLKKGHLQ